MNFEKLLSENLKSTSDILGSVDRLGLFGFQKPQQYPLHQQQVPYSFPPQYPSSSGSNPYIHNDEVLDPMYNDPNKGFGLKFGDSSDYIHTAVETQQSHYGPPPMIMKEGKLKGAALSALTLLAFLFFLNLLQSCLKDHMDAMNPTVG